MVYHEWPEIDGIDAHIGAGPEGKPIRIDWLYMAAQPSFHVSRNAAYACYLKRRFERGNSEAGYAAKITDTRSGEYWVFIR